MQIIDKMMNNCLYSISFYIIIYYKMEIVRYFNDVQTTDIHFNISYHFSLVF